MLNKKEIDKKLGKYIKQHLSKGYSKHAVKKVLVAHGYDELYVDSLLHKHSELQFVKVYTIFISLLFVISVFSFNLISIKKQEQEITGYAISTIDEGCCTAVCQQTAKAECYANFVANKKCDELQDCRVGCCIDKEGYCLTNYLYGNCIRGDGANVNRDCNDIIFCSNITDKSYTSRSHNIKGKKGAGIAIIDPQVDYYGSSFNIRYYIYDKSDVLSIIANIKDGDQIIEDKALYDDGSHNDATFNDNLYANNWDSSIIKSFDGLKKVNVDLIIKFKDGTQELLSNTHTIVVLNNNKCPPILTWNDAVERNVIFAAQNYETLSDGYAQFESDTLDFLNQLFSFDKFSEQRKNLNFYRLEHALTYSSTAELTDIIKSSCTYDNNKDFIIVLDNNETYCMQNQNLIRLNPVFILYNNITKIELSDIFNDLCKYVLTSNKIAEGISNFVNLKIIISTLDNVIYNTSSVNFSFTISASNYPVNYTLFLNDSQVLTNLVNNEINDSVILNLQNGSNYVSIEATDANDNFEFVYVYLNTTII